MGLWTYLSHLGVRPGGAADRSVLDREFAADPTCFHLSAMLGFVTGKCLFLVSVAQTCSRAANLTCSASFIVRMVGTLHNSGEFLGQMPGRFLGRVFLCGVK